MTKLFFDFALIDEYGHIHARRRTEVSEDCAFMSTRIVEDMKAPIKTMNFEQAVNVMRLKEFRKKILIQVAANCGAQLAEQLEDREGWYGIERAERIEAKLNE